MEDGVGPDVPEDFDLDDPFEAALAAAPLDDEPFPAEQRAAADDAWAEYLRGEAVPLDTVRRRRSDDQTRRVAS